MNTPFNQITVPIYKVAPGHARVHFFFGEKPGEMTLVEYCAPNALVLNRKPVPDDEDRGEWQQVFGITLSDPKSASAWSKNFALMAKAMRRAERQQRKYK